MDQPTMSAADRFQVLRHHWRLIALSTALVTIVGVGYSLGQPLSYSAVSRVVIRPVLLQGTATPQDRFETGDDPFGLNAPIDTQAQLLLSAEVAEHVSAELPEVASEPVLVDGRPITDDILEIEASAASRRTSTQMANAYASAFLAMRRDVVRDALDAAIADLEGSITDLQGRTDDARSELSSASGSEERDIQAELTRLRDQIDRITLQRDELLIDRETVTGGGAVVLRAAFASSSGPATLRDGLVAVLLGLILGVGLAFLRGSMDRRLYTPQQVADATGTEIIAAIPRRTQAWGHASGGVTVRVRRKGASRGTTDQSAGDRGGGLTLPPSSASAFVAIRASLVAHGLGDRYRSVTLLSPVPGQGSGIVAGGLAWACANAGLRTIVVDAAAGLDEADAVFGVSAARGLVQVLSDDARVSGSLVPMSVGGLRLLPTGSVDGQAPDVLGSHDLRAFVEQLSRMADVVIVRAPAVSSGGDAVTWTSVTDGAMLLVRAGASKPAMAARAAHVARSVGVPLLGSILVDADRHDGTVERTAAQARRPGPAASKPADGSGAAPRPGRAVDAEPRPEPAAAGDEADRQATPHSRAPR